MSQYSNHFLQCDYLSSSFCVARTNSPEFRPVVSLYIHILDRCIIKILVIDLATSRGSGILFSGYRNIQEKQS